MPSVSVILPTYNRTKFLRLAVESVFAQTYQDWEIIIADDGSAEETIAYLDSIVASGVRILRLMHSGNPSKVRNSAIKLARGRYLAFLDSDDVWASSKLERQISALTDHPQSRWSYSLCNHIDANGRLIPKERRTQTVFSEGWIFEPLLKLQFSVAMPTLVVERDLFQEVGCFDEQQHFGEFHDLCLRLALKSEVVALREPLSAVRMHDQHYSADRVAAHRSWMRLYEKMAALAPDPRLRAYCAKMRAATSIVVARLQGAKGDFKGVSATLREALPFSRRYPTWWYGALRAIVRLTLPGGITAPSSPRRRRDRHKTHDSLSE
jgi:glycosyltransferase involved in cell wall biosynthesis